MRLIALALIMLLLSSITYGQEPPDVFERFSKRQLWGALGECDLQRGSAESKLRIRTATVVREIAAAVTIPCPEPPSGLRIDPGIIVAVSIGVGLLGFLTGFLVRGESVVVAR